MCAAPSRLEGDYAETSLLFFLRWLRDMLLRKTDHSIRGPLGAAAASRWTNPSRGSG
jgi:hypothetical protein